MIFAEIEYKSEEQAKILELSKWFGKDISNLITNLNMDYSASSDILKTINELK